MIDKIRILGIDYIVLSVDTEEDSCGAGQVNNTRCVIKISKNLNNDQHAVCVLLHEIIEALKYRLELPLEHPTITALESSLFQIFKDNPQFVDLLK